jgi:hypothetical protein
LREWLFVLAPVAAVLYFIAFPEQLGPAMDWAESTTRWVMTSL